MNDARQRYYAITGLVLTSLFWAGNIYISKVLIGEVSPLTLNFLRWLIVVLLLTPFTLKPAIAHAAEIKQFILPLSIFGLLGVTVYNTLLYSAAYTTDSINIALISTLTPLLTFVFAWFFSAQVPNINQSVAFILGFVGVLILLGQGKFEVLLDLQFKQGDLLMLVAVLSWAIYTAYLVKKPKTIPPIIFLYVTTTIGVVLAVPSVIWEVYQGDFVFRPSSTNLLAVLYAGVFPSLLSYFFFNYGAEVLGVQSASLCSYLLPIFTALIAILWLNEILTWYHIVSQLLVFFGLFLSLKRE